MKLLTVSQTSALALLALVCGFTVQAPAGEALIFSNTRSRPDPAAATKLSKENANTVKGPGGLNPLQFVEPGNSTPARDRKTERRERNAQIEAKNWIDFDKGELNARDDEKGAFGVRETGSGREPTTEAEFLLEKAERADRTGQPRLASGLSRLPESRQDGNPSQPSNVPAPSQEPGEGETAPSGKLELVPKQGAHVAKELDMKTLFAPGRANSLAPAADKSAITWREILGGSDSPSGAKTEVPRHDETPPSADGFRSAPTSLAPPPAANAGSFNFRNDFASRPAVPTPPVGSDAAARNSSLLNRPGGNSLTSLAPPTAPVAPTATRPVNGFNSYGTAGLVDPYARNNGLGGPPSSSGSTPSYNQPPATPPRSSSGFNTIPSRPGYR